jgi:arginase
MNNIRIILARCFQGQNKRGVEHGGQQLLERLKFPFNVSRVDPLLFENIAKGTQCVHDYTYKTFHARSSPIIIGGDHTVAAGSVQAAVDWYGENLHVVWIDAHADINTPATSNTGHMHGMPVASLLGLMNPLVPRKVKLLPHQITYIGLRDVDQAEEVFLKKHSISVYRMTDVKEKGMETITKEIKQKVQEKKVHMSVDIDALDPTYAPSTGTPAHGGMKVSDITYIIKELSNNICSVDLVEVNPSLGNKKAADTTLDSAAEILNSSVNIKI